MTRILPELLGQITQPGHSEITPARRHKYSGTKEEKAGITDRIKQLVCFSFGWCVLPSSVNKSTEVTCIVSRMTQFSTLPVQI